MSNSRAIKPRSASASLAECRQTLAGCPGPAVYRLPVEKFSGATRSPGFQGFCQGATPCLICSMRSSLTLRA